MIKSSLFTLSTHFPDKFQQFQRNIHAKLPSFLMTEKIKSNKILFVNPSTMILLAFIEDPGELAEALSALELSKKDLIFIPINNNSDATQSGGSHWSLLVFDRHHNTFYYFDSAHEMNRVPAAHTAAKLIPLIHPELVSGKKQHHGWFNLGGHHSDEKPKFHIANAPQQENGYDCGVFTVAIAELIASADHPFKVSVCFSILALFCCGAIVDDFHCILGRCRGSGAKDNHPKGGDRQARCNQGPHNR